MISEVYNFIDLANQSLNGKIENDLKVGNTLDTSRYFFDIANFFLILTVYPFFAWFSSIFGY